MVVVQACKFNKIQTVTKVMLVVGTTRMYTSRLALGFFLHSSAE